MAKVQFVSLTAEQYGNVEKNSDTLYFLSDSHELYKGADRFCFPVKTVESFPATGESGVLYVNAKGISKVWAGSGYIQIAGGTDSGSETDNFLSSAARHVVTEEEAGSGIYTGMVKDDIGVLFTMNNSDTLFVRLTDLVDTYTADNTTSKGVAVTVDGYKISAEANVSTETGNQVVLKDDGIYVPSLEWQSVE